MQEEFLRYSCQIVLPGFSEATQQQLQSARVLIVGAGGLGCPAAQYLTAAGIGTVAIADDDVISISNLHRQILYTPEEAGLKKVLTAAEKLQKQNPFVTVVPIPERIGFENVTNIVEQYDLVIDGSDNFDTKYLLNDACVLAGKPLVYGAIYQYEGQVAVWNIINSDGTSSPNYRDLFPEVNGAEIPNCAEGGVIPTLAGVIGCLQANEVIKYFTKTGELLAGKILLFDVQTMQSRVIKIGAKTKTVITKLPEVLRIPVVNVHDLANGIDKGVYELVDVRNMEEREAFNIGGKHIPLSELQNKMAHFENGKQVIFYCASGKRSAEAVKLVKKNFPNAKVFSLEGGLKAWQETMVHG